MCNACHFMCCGSDEFEGCGCEHCDNSACWPRCEYCGRFESECDCGGGDDLDYEYEASS